MKSQPFNTWLFASALLAAVSIQRSTDAQDAAPTVTRVQVADQPVPTAGQPPLYQPASPLNIVVADQPFAVERRSPASAGAISAAAEAVRAASNEEAKSAAQKKLAELLAKHYDGDMARREQELKQIEERLTKLRELLDRRRTKKQEILDLQMKVALNEAEGLGFYDPERPQRAFERSTWYTPSPRYYGNAPAMILPANEPALPPTSAAPFAAPVRISPPSPDDSFAEPVRP